MRRLTLEERITRLEKLLTANKSVKNEAAFVDVLELDDDWYFHEWQW